MDTLAMHCPNCASVLAEEAKDDAGHVSWWICHACRVVFDMELLKRAIATP